MAAQHGRRVGLDSGDICVTVHRYRDGVRSHPVPCMWNMGVRHGMPPWLLRFPDGDVRSPTDAAGCEATAIALENQAVVAGKRARDDAYRAGLVRLHKPHAPQMAVAFRGSGGRSPAVPGRGEEPAGLEAAPGSGARLLSQSPRCRGRRSRDRDQEAGHPRERRAAQER